MTEPKTITLVVTKDSGNGGYPGHADYKINIQGDISETEIITVTPSDDIIKLNQGLKDAKSATVKLDSSELDFAVISGSGKDINGTITANELTAGKWTGRVWFEVNVEKYGEDVTLDRDNLSIYGIPTSGDVIIPRVVTDSDGVKHRVICIGSIVFEHCDELTSIIIPDTIITICSYSFLNCNFLTSFA